MSTEQDYNRLSDHAYDGIQEYDNPLPGWWTWLFALSIVFSVGYYFYYHMGEGDSVHEKYDAEVAAYFERLLEQLGDIQADDASIIRLMNEPDMMAAMAGMFRGNCAQCHADDGGGNIGPNLTDDTWKNVQRPADIYTVISDGVPGTAMTAWNRRLREPQMILLSAYVASIRGTSPANPLPSDGTRIEPWPTLEDLGIDPDAPNGASDDETTEAPDA